MRGRSASDRFNYLYNESELGEWVPQIRALAAQAASVHVLFNNNYRDYGVRNAAQMTALLGLAAGGPPAAAGPSEAADAAATERRRPPGQASLL
jgi:uncharacterized protein YecE (DUF72 family)